MEPKPVATTSPTLAATNKTAAFVSLHRLVRYAVLQVSYSVWLHSSSVRSRIFSRCVPFTLLLP